MILAMYAIKDELNGFTTPIPFMSEELAKRYFKDQYIGNPTVHNSPKDFSLWNVGSWDGASGTYLQPEEGNKLIERAENYGN